MPPHDVANLIPRGVAQIMAQARRYGAQLYQPPDEEIRGIEPDSWYSPLQPIKPIAPEGTEPKGFQYWPGQNLLWTPRPDALYSAAQLKQLATYPLAAICISNVKDVLCKAPWEIQIKLRPGETRQQAAKRAKGDENILKLTRFFEKPDREHAWDGWLRPLLDDLLVIDAATILIRRTFNGEIAELCVLRGESITRYIDQNGFTPLPPFPAYAQNWWGIPLVNLSTDQLLYKPRNIVPRNTVSSQLYGMSPTEQLAPEIEIGIKRLEFNLAYYTEGSVPGLMQVVPKGTSPDKISEAMMWMNSELAGNLAARRQIRLIQGWNEPGKPDQIVMTKEPLLADNYDDYHIKKIAFGYGTSPQRLSKQLNRASAQQQDEAAELEGTLPYFMWLKRSVMDDLIQHKFGYTDYEWSPDPWRAPSFEKAAEAVNRVMSKPVMTINEVRDRLGLDPREEEEADQLGMATANGWMPLEDAVEIARTQAGLNRLGVGEPAGASPRAKETKPREPAEPTKAEGKPNGKPQKVNGQEVYGFATGVDFNDVKLVDLTRGQLDIVIDGLEKASEHDTRIVIHPGRSLPATIKARHALESILNVQFRLMRRKIKKVLSSLVKQAESEEELIAKIAKLLEDNWRTIAEQASPLLVDSAQAGVGAGATQLDLDDEALINATSAEVAQWARERAAEMVGMRWVGDKLEVNPDAKFAFSDTTMERLADAISTLFEEERISLRDVEDTLATTGIFDEDRVTFISKTEVANVQANANLQMWKNSNNIQEVDWELSLAHDHDDECDELALGSPYPIDAVPPFPAHPNCMCALVVRTVRGE